eukprot:g6645.t1
MALVGASLGALKIFYGVVMFVVAMLCGMLPWRVRSSGARMLSLANAFSGGVFLGAAFLHLLAEAAKAPYFQAWSFPMVHFLCIVGFLLVFGAEQFVEAHCLRDLGRDQLERERESDARYTALIDPAGARAEEEPRSPSREKGGTNLQGLVLVVALSFHAIFDGLAVGATTTPTSVHAVATAVLLHKPIAAFALGSLLISTGSAQSVSALLQPMLVFAATSPVGLVLGMLLLRGSEGDRVELVSAVCQSVAAGTFVYVATVEVVAKQAKCSGNEPKTQLQHFALLCAGVLLSAALKASEPEGL